MEQSWPNRSSPQAQPSQLLSKGPAHNAAGEDIDPPPVVKSFTPTRDNYCGVSVTVLCSAMMIE